MEQVLTDADAEGVTLWLDINPYGPMCYNDLEAWYFRLGFTEVCEPGKYRYRRLPVKTSWTAEEFARDFVPLEWWFPHVCARRRSDGLLVELTFDHSPRKYYDLKPVTGLFQTTHTTKEQ
jgi:hypothetical protein